MNATDIVTGARYALTGCAAVATVENLLVLVVFACTSRLRMKYYGFLINLTLADLFYAVMAIAFTWGGPDYSGILFSIFFSGYFVGIWTILAEGINRYLAVSFVDTARYDELVTRNRLLAVCVLIWIVSLTIQIVPEFSAGESLFEGVIKPTIVYLFWLITAGLYVAVFWKMKSFTHQLVTNPALQPSQPEDEFIDRARQTRRLLVTFTVILVTSFICWMPFSVMQMVAYVHRDLKYQNEVYWLTGVLYCLAPVINPWIYWMRLDSFREGCRKVLCGCFTRDSTELLESVEDPDVL
ncbi:G-protein coupled receptor 12-like [Patiria miniata]|uniref:G-protein coupled receptors family 1 profile domain-containing protein n=1 Tax=Patiria miniata TaxID=46514 RepID=A0A914BE73_PATMI|nr:G-protein coupled receptor 12-like [Patiria miniata]XP_038073727.1 G-protein coupled receptor 12-like [Patiria miniata]XP_038073728.1 G-protein coupled receptor 12-like [Patiria miniata]XP_038073729.1 G-protein coupled receptor 12-like [Patiria miniata]